LRHPEEHRLAPLQFAQASIPDSFKGRWSTVEGDCEEDPSKGVIVLGVTDVELGYYEFSCDILKVQPTGVGVKADVQCIKGAGATGQGYINLQPAAGQRLTAYFSPVGNFANGWSKIFYRCRSGANDVLAATNWNHNGSVVSLIAEGRSRKFFYQSPRAGMWEAGVRPNTLLFEGEVLGNSYRGTAYVFNHKCGATPYEVAGPILEGGRRVVMKGHAPRVGGGCKITGYRPDTLVFELVH